MGKKDLNHKRKREDRDDGEEDNILEADPELEAELAAVRSIRAEKEGKQTDSGANSTVYNRDALLKCIQDLETIDLPFVQTMEVSEFEFPQTNELDDMEREMNFYNHTVMAVKAGQDQLFSLGVPVYRPHDFFCEHVKSDAHMSRIKDRLITEEKRIEAFEKRKNREQSKKFNKQLSLIKKSEKTREERKFSSEIDSVRKSKDGNKDEKLERILNSGADGRPQRGGEKGGKRKAMDNKYGHGGVANKRAKLNDAKSLNDSRDFNPRGGKFIQKSLPKGRAGGGGGRAGGAGVGRAGGGAGRAGFRGGKKPGNNRPGKSSRDKSRTSRKK